MSDKPIGNYTTLTVRSSWPAMSADGATALVFDTVEAGSIAFAVNLEAVQILQKALGQLEAQISQSHGNA